MSAMGLRSRPSIVHAKPSQSRNFPFVQRSGDGIVMPACYSGQFQQTTPAATTSGSIGGNAAMSGYNYYSMTAYYTTSVTQTTPAATTSGSIGGNAAMSGYNYYSMPAYYTTSVTQTTPAATASDSIGGNAAMSGYNYYSMPAYYTTSVTQTTPAATTSGSIGGNAAMSGYNYYSMPIYYVASVAQVTTTTLYNQAGTIYGASGIIGQPSGYGIPMSGYYQMPQNPSTVNRQYGSGMFYGQQPVVYPSVAQATAYSSFPRTHEQMSIWSVWNEWYSQSRSYVLHNNDEYPPHQT
ncbi:Uncharacterized protein BM_BM17416 [Brugia malayi]|uniref:Uncharacterized protein n=1 Tax=Brugia malayi TaxID=6279 RepID=A0A4E9F8X5_BRUMA|nr:Uncharacterized protein BM_BM17416 [Brugia malayi]VIO92472.1 Uncharacterized protein BM_BM17416 [Brugia malayi]